MSDTFKNRAKGEEAKFKLDDEMRFKADARRNKMLGKWAAEKLGLTSADAEAFIKQVVLSDLEEQGHEDVVRKVAKDFSDAGVDITADQIRAEINRLQPLADAEVLGNYPEPLGGDHGRVGN